jgi:lipopolysaccharide transport system ATP-binding protein
MKNREITRKFSDIVEFSGIGKFIDTPVKRYSSGMYVRLAFAVAAHLEPEILLVDEVLAVGDAEFQRRCLGRMEDFSVSGRTVLFVSHNMQTMAQLCDRVIWLDGGRVMFDGPSSEVIARYLQSGYGAGASLEWRDLESAPGGKFVRLRRVRVVQDGKTADAVDVRRPVGIEIAFRVLRGDQPVIPKIKVANAQGNVAFNAMDTSSRWQEPTPPGDYVAPKLWPHGNASLAFHVHDPMEGDSARGFFTGQWKGAVRPLLEWTCEEQ